MLLPVDFPAWWWLAVTRRPAVGLLLVRTVDVERLKRLLQGAVAIQRDLRLKPYEHERIRLSVEEACRKGKELEEWLDDVLFIVESELHNPRP